MRWIEKAPGHWELLASTTLDGELPIGAIENFFEGGPFYGSYIDKEGKWQRTGAMTLFARCKERVELYASLTRN